MMHSKSIFLTGATGLVGTALSGLLSQQSYNITALSRNQQAATPNIEWIQADLMATVPSLEKHLEDIEVVVHNAASVKAGKTATEQEELDKVNVQFTRQLLNAAVKAGVKKIVFTSSFSFIRKPLPEIITELSPLDAQTPYSRSKFEGEQLIQEYAAKYGIVYNILRISSPVSFRFDMLPQTVVKIWIEKSKAGQTIQAYGKGGRTQDFVATADIAGAFLNAIEKPGVSGIFNIASGNTLSMKQLAELITSRFGNKYEISGEDVNESDRWNISIEKAKRDLGYKPQFTSETCIQTLLDSIK